MSALSTLKGSVRGTAIEVAVAVLILAVAVPVLASSGPAQVKNIWRSDGTSAGTVVVRSWPAGDSGQPGLAIGSRLYFTANDGTHGYELWKYTP